MQNINNVVQNFLKRHKNNQRYIFVLVLLSVMVIAIVCSSLITPAVSMTGELVCQKEQHTHSEECYAETLVCTEDTEGHHHSADCYTTQTELVCGLEEDENHTHSDECYNNEMILNCDKQEGEVHTHTEECYERELICGKEEHTHTDECYDNSPEESIKEAEKETEVTEASEEENNDPEILVVDPIDAEYDNLVSSMKVNNSGSKTNKTYSTNGNVTIIDEISVDFGQFINNIEQKDVAGGTVTETVKTIKFTISYNLPEKTLMNGNTNRQIHCLLPDNVEITDAREGPVRKEGQEIGTYKITADGYIIIEFDQNFVKEGESAITGDITFNANVHKTDESSNYETVTIGNQSVNIPFPKNDDTPSYDLSVNKTCGDYDRDTKQIPYTIEIKSWKGSGDGNITVTDNFPSYVNKDYISLDLQDGQTVAFTKKTSDGSTSEITGTVSVAADGTVTITGLPALEAGESYSLTYTATLNTDNQTLIKADNSVSVSNGELTDQSTCYKDVAVSCGITKSGKYNDKTDMVEWTIIVTNPFGESLDGYSISDDMIKQAVNGLTITDADGYSETLDSSNLSGTTGSLDIDSSTFSFSSSASNSKYTLTYATKLPDRTGISNNSISNKAVLKSGSTEINAPEASASIWGDRRSVYKSYQSVSRDDTTGNLIINWLTKLEFQIGDFNGKTFNDTMLIDGDYHYMTRDQLGTLNLVGFKADSSQVSLDSNDYTVKWYDSVGNEITDDTEKIYSFEITFADTDKISELCDIYIYYTVTGSVEDMELGSHRRFTNKSSFDGVESSASYWEYKSQPFVKYDSSVSGQASSDEKTYHVSNDLEKDENGNLILKWYIDANESRYFSSTQDAVLTDTLPAGVTINEDSIRYGDWSNGYYSLVDNNMTYVINENGDGQQVVTFTVPADTHNGKKFRIDYAVTVSEEYMQNHKDARGRTSFKNTVTDGSYTNEQTQYVERSLITKSGMASDESYDGYIDYVIDVNPKAELLTNNGKITVSDKINYQWSAFAPTLVKVKVYSVDDSSGVEQLTELDPSEYNLSYANDSIDATFTIILPDSMHLKIKYTYHCVYKNPEWFESNDGGVVIYNSAKLDYNGNTQEATFNNRYYLNRESNAHAAADDYLKIEKVDSENYGVKLSGAEFALYKWDGSQWYIMTNVVSSDTDSSKTPEWTVVPAEDSTDTKPTPYKMSTGGEGKATLPQLESGTLYKIEELTAPTDYIKSSEPWYFAENSVPSSLPTDVSSGDVKLLLKGGIITIPNKLMQKTEIEVEKIWRDSLDAHNPVEVELLQSKTSPDGEVDGPEITINLTDANGYSETLSFNVIKGFDLNLQIDSVNAFLPNKGGSIYVNDNPFSVYDYTYFRQIDWKESNGNYYQSNLALFGEINENTIINIYVGDVYPDKETHYDFIVQGLESAGAVVGIPEDAKLLKTDILSADNNWKITWDDIPATDEYGYNYYYYVREKETITDYTTTYDNNGANGGKIYIINTHNDYSNELPATGGTGKNLIKITGAAIISGSALFYILSKRRIKRQRR